MHDSCMGLMAKYWEPGKVKTRLAATVGDELAAAIYREMLLTSLERLDGICRRNVLAATPREKLPHFQAVLPESWLLQSQVEGDLGLRMRSFFEQSLGNDVQRVVLMGTDSPHVPRKYVEEAFEALLTSDVVLGPAEDGGYWLIGVARRVPPIFAAIDWGTSKVLQQTLEALAAADIRHARVATWYDLDESQDLDRLLIEIQRGNPVDLPLQRLGSRLKSLLDVPQDS